MNHLPHSHTIAAIATCSSPSQPPVPHQATHAAPGVMKIQLITAAWMLIECSVAIVSAWHAKSSALLAFGTDSFVEFLSAWVVILQFTPRLRLSSSVAARFAGILLLALAAIVTAISVSALVTRVQPDASPSGIAVTVAALALMPVLSRAKRRAARRTGDRALAADAVQSATCAYLAAITLIGLLLNAAFHVRWVDPLAALVAVPIICIEARRALRGQPCGCA